MSDRHEPVRYGWVTRSGVSLVNRNRGFEREYEMVFVFDDDHFVKRWDVPSLALEQIATWPWACSSWKGDFSRWSVGNYSLILRFAPWLDGCDDDIDRLVNSFGEDACRLLADLTEGDYLEFLKSRGYECRLMSKTFMDTLLGSLNEAKALRQRIENARLRGLRV